MSITFTRQDAQRVVVSAIGALLVSTACVGAAVFPVNAAEVTVSTAADWQTAVERQIDAVMQTPVTRFSKVAMSEVVMHFDGRGAFRSATLARTSGSDAVDREALRVANAITYPALPTHLQGKPQNVAMQIFVGNDAANVERQRKQAEKAAEALAAKADANRAEARIAVKPAA
jgi:hypothetical protein